MPAIASSYLMCGFLNRAVSLYIVIVVVMVMVIIMRVVVVMVVAMVIAVIMAAAAVMAPGKGFRKTLEKFSL